MRVNERIRARQIRTIGAGGEQIGILPTDQALRLAREAGLDLVEVAPTADPPVCRIMDYSKYKYEQSKREREARKKQRVVHVKEIKLSPKIEEHDYQVKLHHLERFLKRGDKVKVTLKFRGREITHLDLGRRVLDRLTQDTSDAGVVEKAPVIEGRNMIMVIVPK